MNRIQDQVVRFFRTTPVTADLIVINLVMFIATLALGGFDDVNLVRLGGLVPAYVTENGEWLRILAAMFLHGSVLHFVMNMVALYYLGSAMERVLGPLRHFALYLFAGVGGNLVIAFFGSPDTLTIGASGALYGIMAAMFYITLAHRNWFTPASVAAIRRMIVINFALTFLLPGISVIGHLAGFGCGLLAAVFLVPSVPHFAQRRRMPVADDDAADDDGPSA